MSNINNHHHAYRMYTKHGPPVHGPLYGPLYGPGQWSTSVEPQMEP